MAVIYDIASNEAGLYVAVGRDEAILVSSDNGVSWWEPPTQPNSGEILYGVAFGEIADGSGGMTMRFVAVGSNGTIIISNEMGVSVWSIVSSGLTGDIRGIAFSGSSFLAVGSGGKMLSSLDFGVTWEEEHSGTTEDLFSITIDGDLYTIIGDNGVVLVGSVSSVEEDVVIIEGFGLSTPVDPSGTLNVSALSTLESTSSVGGRRAGMAVDFEIGGTVEVGDSFTITLDGVDFTYVVAEGSHDPVALSTASPYTGPLSNLESDDGSYMIFNETSGTPGFDVRFKFVGVEVSGSLGLDFAGHYDGHASHLPISLDVWNWDTQSWDVLDNTTIVSGVVDQIILLTLTPTAHVADSVQLDPAGANGAVGDVWVRVYHAAAGSPSHDLYIDHLHIHDDATNLSEIANELSHLIDADPNFVAYLDGNSVVVVSGGGEPVDFTYSVATINGGATDDQTITPSVIQESMAQKISATVGGTFEIGDVFTVTLDGVDFTATATSPDASNADTATRLAAIIDASPDFVASASGAVVTIQTATPAEPFTYSSSTTNGGATNDQTLTLDLVRSSTALGGLQGYDYITESPLLYGSMAATGGFNHQITDTALAIQSFVGAAGYRKALVETVTATATAGRVVQSLASVIDSLVMAGVVTSAESETIKEAFYFLTQAETGGSTIGQAETISFTVNDSLLAAFGMFIVEAFEATSSSATMFDLALHIIERLTTGAVVNSHLDAIAIAAEALSFAEQLTSGKGGDLTESLTMAPMALDRIMANALALELATMTETTDGMALVSIPIQETATLVGHSSVSALFQSALSEGVMFSISFGMDGVQYNGWVMNAESFGVWEYQDFPFDSMVNWQGVPLGFNQNGVYRLDGDSDDGAIINAKLLTGQSNLGTSNLKTLPVIYLGFRANGDILLKTITKESIVRWHRLRPDGNGLHERRVKCGRGVKSTYWSLEIENVDGADFAIDVAELYPVVSSRKVGG